MKEILQIFLHVSVMHVAICSGHSYCKLLWELEWLAELNACSVASSTALLDMSRYRLQVTAARVCCQRMGRGWLIVPHECCADAEGSGQVVYDLSRLYQGMDISPPSSSRLHLHQKVRTLAHPGQESGRYGYPSLAVSPSRQLLELFQAAFFITCLTRRHHVITSIAP